MMRARLIAATAAVGSIAAIALLPAPAQGHDTWVYHGNDYGHLGYEHYTVYGCDKEADGHGVRTH